MEKVIQKMNNKEIEDEVIEYTIDRYCEYEINSVKNALYEAIIDGILYAGILYNIK